MTSTYAKLPLTRASFNEIRDKLIAAGYNELIHDGRIDLTGIAVVPFQEREHCRRCNTPLPSIGVCPVCQS